MAPIRLAVCEECGGHYNEHGVGHAMFCSKCTDDGSDQYTQAWLDMLPENVRRAMRLYPPEFIYEHKGQQGCIISYTEDDDGAVHSGLFATKAGRIQVELSDLKRLPGL